MMLYVSFIALAIITVLAAIKLSRYADVIQLRTGMTGFFAGAVLIAGATSLPEVTTSVTAGIIRSPDLAVGNVLGSNLFNLLVLAVVDLWFRQKQMYRHVSRKSFMPGALGLLLTVVIAVAMIIQTPYSFFGMGIDVLLVVMLYFGGLYYLNRRDQLPDEPGMQQKLTMTLKSAVVRFAIMALLIMAAGSVLTIVGDKIALQSGLGESFVGSLLIAGATSLPEVSIVYLALKQNQFSAALGVIIGSNMFNLTLLAIADLFYLDATLIRYASASHWITMIGLLFLTIVVLTATLRGGKVKRLTWLPSLLVVIGYMSAITLLYFYGSL